MIDKRNSVWVDLYNTLFLVSSNYGEIKHLESPIFEVLDELETVLYTAFRLDVLNQFQENGWIDEVIKTELVQFYNHVDKIENSRWNSIDFDNYEDWVIAKKWAKSLMNKLNMDRQGWDSTGSTVIYLD
ncbi:MAG: hypothetical protein AAFN93_22225 [Bacteroidota bacterium]